MQQILFICTGNYYRSRFAEIYFNHLANERKSAWSAFSRGLEVHKHHNVNPGPISQHTLNYLDHLSILPPSPLTNPQQFEPKDLQQAHTSILMYENEHRPMMIKYHPELVEQVNYWSFPDIDISTPEIILPQVKGAVEKLWADLNNW